MTTPVDPTIRDEGTGKKAVWVSDEHVDYLLDDFLGEVRCDHLRTGVEKDNDKAEDATKGGVGVLWWVEVEGVWGGVGMGGNHIGSSSQIFSKRASRGLQVFLFSCMEIGHSSSTGVRVTPDLVKLEYSKC